MKTCKSEDGTFYQKLFQKFPDQMAAQYQCWIMEHKKVEKVEKLFQMAAAEAIYGLHWKTGISDNRQGHSFFRNQGQGRK